MTEQKRIHWLGAGLASVPGIRRLIKVGLPVTLWERDLAKAQEATNGLDGNFEIRSADNDALAKSITNDDIVVSMLPASMHPTIAELCLEKSAHFVSSSYISPEMQALGEKVKERGLIFINEVGLDPGIDHLLAHLLIADYKASNKFDPENSHEFRSYCGGFPAIANNFKYKFSWSPLGVLKALNSPARAIKNGKEARIERPWDAVEDYKVMIGGDQETFQSYPNRDSLPFIKDYGIDSNWKLAEFVRGTLRLDGWSEAWQGVFKTIETAHSAVLSVELKVSDDDEVIWHKTKVLNSFGNPEDSAMGRLVSIPVSLAAEAIWLGKLDHGLQAAPSDAEMIKDWLQEISRHGDHITHIDHLTGDQDSGLIEAAE